MRRLFLLVAIAVAAPALAEKPTPPRWETVPLPPAMPDATSTGFVDSGGAKIYYARYGEPGKPPVILLHGGLGNSDHFAFQVPALVDKFDVITIDSRGQGRSTLSKTKLSYHSMAGDVIAVMDKLEIAKAHIVGWSDGGAIALDLAINQPKRVDKLFVFGTNYHTDGSKPRKGGSGKTFNAYAVKCKSDFMKLSKTPSSYEATVSALAPIWRTQGGFSKDQIRSIKATTLVADGDHDEIINLDHIREMALLIPNGKSVVFKDTSHFALWQDPDTFNKTMVEFLAPPAAQ